MSHKVDRLQAVCITCQKPFLYLLSARPNVKYCSRKCQNNSPIMRELSRQRGLKNKGKYSGKNNPNFKHNYFNCKECGIQFSVEPNEIKSGKRKGLFCSIKCLHLYWSKYKMSDIQRRLQVNMRRSILRYIRKDKNSWTKLVDYTKFDLMKHLEKQFTEGMTWENYGKWHIDHIKPVTAFKFNSYKDKEFKECWSLSNLQPLWASDNIRKGNKYEGMVRCGPRPQRWNSNT